MSSILFNKLKEEIEFNKLSEGLVVSLEDEKRFIFEGIDYSLIFNEYTPTRSFYTFKSQELLDYEKEERENAKKDRERMLYKEKEERELKDLQSKYDKDILDVMYSIDNLVSYINKNLNSLGISGRNRLYPSDISPYLYKVDNGDDDKTKKIKQKIEDDIKAIISSFKKVNQDPRFRDVKKERVTSFKDGFILRNE